jgi:hypothetical protein
MMRAGHQSRICADRGILGSRNYAFDMATSQSVERAITAEFAVMLLQEPE